MTMSWLTRAPKRHYLDWASAAPVHDAAKEALSSALPIFGNPSSPHTEGRAARAMLDAARVPIARLAGVKERAVLFTSGATEANALAILGRAQRAHSEGTSYASMHMLYLPTMHASAIKAVEALAARGVITEALPFQEGVIDLAQAATLIRPETILVCMDAVCGETGIRYDTLGVRRVLDAFRRNKGSEGSNDGTPPKAQNSDQHVALMIDASQLPLVEPINHTRLGADLLTLDAQKVGGVRGIGALIIPKHDLIAPVIEGGGQEAGLRPGTEPVALALAFAKTLSVRAEGAEAFLNSARASRANLVKAIERAVPQVLINEAAHSAATRDARQAPHILNISLPGVDTDYLVVLLDRDGFAVSTKSACETDSGEGSRAVRALYGDAAHAASTLRISWGPETPQAALQAFPRALSECVHFLRAG